MRRDVKVRVDGEKWGSVKRGGGKEVEEEKKKELREGRERKNEGKNRRRVVEEKRFTVLRGGMKEVEEVGKTGN